jgi:hypothetical protein
LKFIGRLLDLPKRVTYEALDTVDLLSVADRHVRNYSSGMKQRLGMDLGCGDGTTAVPVAIFELTLLESFRTGSRQNLELHGVSGFFVTRLPAG